jgi:hypothetical protein
MTSQCADGQTHSLYNLSFCQFLEKNKKYQLEWDVDVLLAKEMKLIAFHIFICQQQLKKK